MERSTEIDKILSPLVENVELNKTLERLGRDNGIRKIRVTLDKAEDNGINHRLDVNIHRDVQNPGKNKVGVRYGLVDDSIKPVDVSLIYHTPGTKEMKQPFILTLGMMS